jgi:hypothetical protein
MLAIRPHTYHWTSGHSCIPSEVRLLWPGDGITAMVRKSTACFVRPFARQLLLQFLYSASAR